jgi:FlaA1/EpsC-like NDP-sugar epimerase
VPRSGDANVPVNYRRNHNQGSAATSLFAAVSPLMTRPAAFLGRHLRAVKAVQVGLDATVLAAALLLAYELRFDFAVPAAHRDTALAMLPLVLAVQFASLALARVYSFMWRYVGMVELAAFVRAAALAVVPLALLRLDLLGALGLGESLHMPLSVVVLDTLLGFSGVFALRVARRLVFEVGQRNQARPAAAPAGERVLLVGAGRSGIGAVQALQRRGDEGLCVVGFIDNDPAKQGQLVNGLRVLGTTADLPRLVRALGIDHVVITLTSASRREIRRIVELCERIPIKARIIPGLRELLHGNVEATIRAVDIEDLLGREPVVLAQDHLTPFVRGKRVMITGAGGSIGSELCRQVARLAPDSLVLVERCEFALWSIERELRAAYPDLDVVPRLADVGDRVRMRDVFSRHRPHIVLHAAAHKHVPMVEANPCEAIKNNVFGTRTTGQLAGEYGVETFVLVSTDKAVRPTSMMGATKRVCELVVQGLGAGHATNFMAVRFGNVLGSTGSVVPIFREQIARGGPVTITHPEMVRFFMTIPEAAQLVLQAGAMQAGGEIFVLDMGEPVKIVDLATDMIKLCGLRPDEDIEIVFSGVRPGEKLYEELSTDGEVLGTTRHPKILSGKLAPPRPAELERDLEGLAAIVGRGDASAARRHLARMIPEAQLGQLGIVAAPAAEPRETVAA